MIELGNELKEIRLSKGFTQDDVFKHTRVNKDVIEKMEAGDFQFLPQVYVKAFFKKYILFLELDETEYLKKFDNLFNVHPKKSFSSSLKEEHKEVKKTEPTDTTGKEADNTHDEVLHNKKIKPVFVISIIVLIIVVAVIIKNVFFEDIQLTSPKNQKTDIQPQERFSETKENVKSDSLGLNLELVASDKVWIQLISDGKSQLSFTMQKGESSRYKANQYFELIVGSLGSVTIKLNDKIIPAYGSLGLVKRMRLDTSGFKFLLTPQKTDRDKTKLLDSNG